MPKEHLDWLWRASLLFGAVPALLIIAVRSKFMNESPLWAANQGDLTSAVRILRDSYGINAHEAPPERPAPPPKVSFRVLFAKPYRERTIVAGVMNVCISFEYTAIAFFLPSILAQFLGAGVFETISASLGLQCAVRLYRWGCWGCTWHGNTRRDTSRSPGSHCSLSP
ncbi:transporter [Klebsiella michiganensis]|uniref:Transporter n=1 Tax=Klebsiella michiganensis TaxID=1134687 RepID=A0A7H4N0K4_9ENTR|nr:transporter [Klebsiella michiganensis]